MGKNEILSHVEMTECSIRIIGMKESGQVAPHHHEKSTQIHMVLENEVEMRVGDLSMRLRPYETVRIEKGDRHSMRTVDGAALVMSLSIPPLDRNDHFAA